MYLTAKNVNDAFYNLVYGIHSGEIPVLQESSRNGSVLRIPGVTVIEYCNPRQRVLFNSARDANPFFHLFESLWMLAGRQDVASVAYYAKPIAQYSDDGETLNGAYGYRWRTKNSVDQLTVLIEHLLRQPHSRRAVLQMWDVEQDLLKVGGCTVTTSSDVCCNLSACFSVRVLKRAPSIDVSLMGEAPGTRMVESPLIEKAVLDMTVFNRSNDMVLGALGANVVHFSMLQEYLANCMGIEVGTYSQVSNNMHVYTSNESPSAWLASTKNWNPSAWLAREAYGPAFYPSLGCNLVQNRTAFDKEVEQFVAQYGSSQPNGTGSVEYTEPFLLEVAQPMCLAWAAHKHRSYELATHYVSQVHAEDWQIAGSQWLLRRKQQWEFKQRMKG
jgi:thymidylate synthase